jgi:hypothetical protein
MTSTTTEAKTYRPFLECVLQAAGNPELPDSYDTWGFKITRPDLRTCKAYGSETRFRWPFPGGTVTDPETVVDGESCPTSKTGGYCIALSLAGAASGGYGHATILLLAYRLADIAGENEAGKRRVSHALVVDVVAGQDAYRLAKGADLTDADLTRANLTRADLTGANLTGANLTRANLTRAYQTRAYLAGANLAGADLAGADLAGANLAGAYLAGANLAGANLTDANLTDAKVRKSGLTAVQLVQFTGVPVWVAEVE